MKGSILEKLIFGFVCIMCVVPNCRGLFSPAWYRRVTSFQENEECQSNGNGTNKYAIIIHGWRENCREKWIKELNKNLETYRGGCIMCMDYELAANIPHYLMLAHHVTFLAYVLKEKLQEMEFRGYEPENGYIFGFSLGARLAIRAGILFGHQRLGELDACDMAGPVFDWFDQFEPILAAKNVQCIHTSKDKGTTSRNCHQNWNMGVCGMYQVGSGVLPGTVSSHGLCPRFYNSAFKNNFYAEEIPEQCNFVSNVPQTWPNNYKMGYMERRKSQVRGILYASTISEYPYTTNANQVIAWRLPDVNRRYALIVPDPHPDNYILYSLENFGLNVIVLVTQGSTDLFKN